ncbi:MAG: hypothetical protein PHV30_10290 [Candidatus Margulisbacteria bacterium]|nr:hypothetical protein [Candidatus Margulisiibacteriota bacterium]
MNKKLIAVSSVALGTDSLILPEEVSGSMNAFGGRIMSFTIPLQNIETDDDRLRAIALYISRMSNLMVEDKIVLDMPQVYIDKINMLLDKKSQNSDIGYRLESIKVVSAEAQQIGPRHNVVNRLNNRDLITRTNPDADTCIALSFGSTNFRFELVKAGKVLARHTIAAQLPEISDEEVNAALQFPFNGDTQRILNTLHFIRNLHINSLDILDLNQRGHLEQIQLARIKKGIWDLINSQGGINNFKLLGIAFSSAGLIDYEQGTIRASRIHGFGWGLEIVEYLEEKFGLPVIALNDVDSEGMAAVQEQIKKAEKQGHINHYPWTVADNISNLKAGQSLVVTVYGGGTGIGGVQIEVSRNNNEQLTSKILTGRKQSAGELGHNLMDFTSPEVRKVWDETRKEADSCGISEDFLQKLIQARQTQACPWCGNFFDLESMASGVAGDFFAKWLYQYLLDNKYNNLFIFDHYIINNHNLKSETGRLDPKVAIENVNIADLLEVITDIREADIIIKLMVRMWAAHIAQLHKDSLGLEFNGVRQDWNNFIITHKLSGGTYFKLLLIESLREDYGLNFRDNIFIEFNYNVDNQALGAVPALQSAVKEARKLYGL